MLRNTARAARQQTAYSMVTSLWVLGTREMRRVHEEGGSDFNFHLVDVYNAKKQSPGRHFPPSFPHVSLAPKTHFPFPLKCLPHRLSDVRKSVYFT